MAHRARARIAAVVLNWNRRADTRACLASLAASDLPLDVLVVDNGSTECPPEDLVAGVEGPGLASVETLANGTNLGFARGMNGGLDRAVAGGAELVWVLNNDVTVAPDAARRLVEALDAGPDVALAGPAVYDMRRPGVLSNAGGRLSLARGRTWHLHEGLARPPATAPYEVDYCEGCAVMVRAEDLRAQGGFDPAYVAYWEDVDWCLTARGRGRRVIVVPEARVEHRVSASSGVASAYAMYHRARNRFRCVGKHGTRGQRAAAVAAAVLDLPLDLWHARRASGGTDAPRAWLAGTLHGILGR